MSRTTRFLSRFLSPSAMGWVDYWLRPHLRQSLGKPFNDQDGRLAIVHDLFRTLDIDAIIETGTFRGGTTGFLATTFQRPVHTVEISARYQSYAKQRLRGVPHIHFNLDDSRRFLKHLSTDAALQGQTLFIYLDAHWDDDLPLHEELQVIADAWPQSIILIDDFHVPGDEGYGYDTYAKGTKPLSLAYLEPERNFDMAAFFPTLPSDQETGRCRGCVVLTPSPEIAAKLAQLPTLRAAADVQAI